MVSRGLSRRSVALGLALISAVPARVLAEEVIDLEWDDLLPVGEKSIPPVLRGLIEHDEGLPASEQPASSGVRTDWNGRIVRLSGFIVPLDYSGSGVTAFILVPYIGACVHVPPPPANQLVLVTTSTPYENKKMFAAVSVIGMFGTAATSTQLADIGYALSADLIEPYYR